MSGHRAGGFTLLELAIALVMVGILTVVAVASWAEHGRRARRSDATVALLMLAAAQEAYYLETGRYAADPAPPPPAGLGLGGSEHGWYQLRILSAGSDGFVAAAVPAPGSPQQADARCQRFVIDARGARQSAPGTVGECWR